MKKYTIFTLIALAALISSCLSDSDSSSNLTYSTIDADIPLTVTRYFASDEEVEPEIDPDVTPEGENEGEGDENTETKTDSNDDTVVTNPADLYTSFPAYGTMTFDYKITSTITSATIKSVTMIGENSDRFKLTRHETDPWRFSVTTTSINDTNSTIKGTVYVTANNVKGGLSHNVMQLSAFSRPTARYITIVPYILSNSTDTVDWDQYGEGKEQTFLATVNNGSQSELHELDLRDDEGGNFELIETDIDKGLITVRAKNENRTGKILTANLYAALDPNSEETKGEFIFANAKFSQLTYINPITPPSISSMDTSILDFEKGYKAGDKGTRQIVIAPGAYTIVAADLEYDSNEGYTIEFVRTATNTYNVVVTVNNIGANYANNVFSEQYIYINYVDENGDAQRIKSEETIKILFHVND